jgi:hypothetical protein
MGRLGTSMEISSGKVFAFILQEVPAQIHRLTLLGKLLSKEEKVRGGHKYAWKHVPG